MARRIGSVAEERGEYMNENIVLFYDNQLPEGSANATRVVSLSKVIKMLGNNVMMLGLNYQQNRELQGIYEGIPYALLDLPELRMTGMAAFRRQGATRGRLAHWLDEYWEKNKIDGIIVSCMNGFADFFFRYGKRKQIPIAFNHVEWHLRSAFPGKFGIINYYRNKIDFYYTFAKTKNIIAISTFLEHFYQKRGCNTVRIPTIVDVHKYKCKNTFGTENRLVLAYAGCPGKKDAILNVISAMTELTAEEQQQIEFRLFGITAEQLLINYNLGEKEESLVGLQVRCMGVIPHAYVNEELIKADFTVLLRQDSNNANAGFPTKVGESMAAGVPVIANLTSDLAQYIHEGKEGMICRDESPKACAETLRRALKLSMKERREMSTAARKQAEKSFDYGSYGEDMQHFLEKAKYIK